MQSLADPGAEFYLQQVSHFINTLPIRTRVEVTSKAPGCEWTIAPMDVSEYLAGRPGLPRSSRIRSERIRRKR